MSVLLCMWIITCAVGCEPALPSSPAPPAAGATQRVVSLSPAITSTIVALGAGDALVGRTPWCRSVSSQIAVAWDGVSVDAERMIALRPTLIVFQDTMSGGPRDEVARLSQAHRWRVGSWRLDRLSEVRDMIHALAQSLGASSVQTAVDLLQRFDEACTPDANAIAVGPTLLLFATDPPMAFGPGSYVDDIWRALGGRNAVTTGAYPELTVEEMVRIDPAWVVVVGPDRLLDAARRLPVAALREGRVSQAADPGLLEPGAAVIPAIEAMRRDLAERRASGATVVPR